MINDRLPDTVLAEKDPGDETQKRFRYQAAVAAYFAVDLLTDTPDLKEVFCEHHEDILLKRSNDKYVGIQVKTRREGLSLFEADDEVIINSLLKFIKLDNDFPNCFEEFIIVTNYSFYNASETGKNLHYLLYLIKEGMVDSALLRKRVLTTYLKTLNQKSGVSTDQIITTLLKVRISEFPKFENIQIEIINLLKEILDLGKKTFLELNKLAETLVNTIEKASRREVDNARYYFLGLAADPEEALIGLIIEGKRITAEKLIKIIEENLEQDVILPLINTLPIGEMSKGFRKLETKMSAGGIVIDNIELAKNHKHHMEALAARWIGKYACQAQARYDQIHSIVITECREAYDEAYKSTEPFGSTMLINLRQRLRQRWEIDKPLIYDCTYEHLCGMAGILTEDCRVWWSDKFEFVQEDG